MKLIYITAKKYPASTADHIFIKEMAKVFGHILSKDFLFVATNIAPGEFEGIPNKSLGLNLKRGLSLYYFFWLPFFIMMNGHSRKDTIFFSNDPNLLSILIFWKKMLSWKYQIVSEWHMLFGDRRDAYISRNSTKLIATTNHLKSLISSRFGIDERNILTVYGGVSMEKFNTNTRKDILPRSFKVGYVGFYKTMGMQKGIDTMIEALALIKETEIAMAFVGGRPEEIKEYTRMAEENGLSNRILFVSVVSTEEVASYELAMDILVIPYPDKPHFREYGFPMKVYEYMASKKPVIYSDLPIISEVLGNCALPFKSDDPRDLADKILYLKNNPLEGADMANRAYDKVANYTWTKRAENIIAFLKGI